MDSPDDATLAYAELRPEQILDALEALEFRCDGRFLALNSYENRVYQIGIEDGAAVVVKFYRPGRWTDEAIIEEHEFSNELEAADLPVVTPLLIDGRSLHTSGLFRFSVYPCRGGRAPDLDNLRFQQQLGRLVGRLHLVGNTRMFCHRPDVDIDSYGVQSRDYLLRNDFIPTDLRPAYETVADQVLDGVYGCFARAGSFDRLRLHGDFHPGNVLADGEQLHLVDLDDARHGPAVQDLWMFLSGDQLEQLPQLEALLEGYEEFRHFDARELHLIEALRSLRLMHYSAWIARRWADPAFQTAFPWFDSQRYWDEQVLALREQIALMQEAPLEWRAR